MKITNQQKKLQPIFKATSLHQEKKQQEQRSKKKSDLKLKPDRIEIPSSKKSILEETNSPVADSSQDQIDNDFKSLRFKVDRETGNIVIQIIDFDTNEVIKQISDRELLLQNDQNDQSSGLLIDKKV